MHFVNDKTVNSVSPFLSTKLNNIIEDRTKYNIIGIVNHSVLLFITGWCDYCGVRYCRFIIHWFYELLKINN